MSPFSLLVIIALVLSVVGMVRPAWPLVPVAVLLLCVALLIGQSIKF